jgi:hypothetical protein
MDTYIDPILRKYGELILANTGAIKEVYYGEPQKFPSVDIPCIFISKRATNADALTDTEDQHNMAITITVVTDIRSDLTTQDAEQNVVAGIATLYDIMEGRNEDYTLKDTAILNILRHNFVASGSPQLITDLDSVTHVDYMKTLSNRAPQQWTVQASVDIVCKFIQTR